MDSKIWEDIYETKEETLKPIQDKLNYKTLVERAWQNWIEYEPTPKECRTIGIDGSLNNKDYQGVLLYIVTAAAVDCENNKLPVGRKGCGSHWEKGIGIEQHRSLSRIMIRLELKIANEILIMAPEIRILECYANGMAMEEDEDASTIILMDGSFELWLKVVHLRPTIRLFLQNLRRKATMIKGSTVLLFVDKTPKSRTQFQDLNLYSAADVYYYNNASQDLAGFSKPVQDEQFLQEFGITLIEVYTRLRPGTPMIKLVLVNTSGTALTSEMLKKLETEDIPELLNKLVYDSMTGYPYCLKLADNVSNIRDDDMNRAAHFYEIHNETGPRDSLHDDGRKRGDYGI